MKGYKSKIIGMEKFSQFFLDKCMNYAVRIVNLYNYLRDKKHVTVISKQLLRSGTSIGANYAEATNAISHADFTAKSSIALKEATESLYWIELLHKTSYLSDQQYTSIKQDSKELISILTSSLKKLKGDD